MNGPRQKPHGGEPAAGSLDHVIYRGAEYQRDIHGQWFPSATPGDNADEATTKSLEAWRVEEIERRKKRGL